MQSEINPAKYSQLSKFTFEKKVYKENIWSNNKISSENIFMTAAAA
jgi:hypothetical protein